MNNNRKWIVRILVTVSAVIGSIFLTATYAVVENKILDGLFNLRGPLDVSESPIVLLAISEQADDEMPSRYPWPREYYARVIKNLNKAGAKVIGIDVRFDKADLENPSSDSALARVLAEYDNVVLAGNVIREERRSFKSGISLETDREQLDPPYLLFDQANPNPWGFVGVSKDPDGVLRKYNLVQKFADQEYYPLGIEMLRIWFGDTTTVSQGKDWFRVGNRVIPKSNDNYRMIINYHGGQQIFPQFSFDQVIDDADFLTNSEDPDFQINAFDDEQFGLLHSNELRGKIVLIGATMFELHDFYATPFSPKGDNPGFEVHANAMQTILSENYIYDVDARISVFVGLIFALIFVFASTRYSVVMTLPFLIFAIVAGGGLSIYLFVEHNIYFQVVNPMLSMVFAYIGSVVFDYLNQLGEKRRIKSMFASYVSPDLVNKMISSGEEPKLGGEETYITAFFSDIASFSTFSELLSPTQLVELINEYLTEMTEILSDEGGTLDKYIGDAIVAFFGAPLHMDNHAYKACVTSQYMLLKLAELRQKWRSEGEMWPSVVAEMCMRIGLNTGEMVTGNMGSTRRFNYTMMGDNVNLAARCESGAKAYGVFTMVTEATKVEAEKYGDDLIFRFLDKIVVKGRTQPVSMYEIVGLKTLADQKMLDCVGYYEQGIEKYLKQDFESAIANFEKSKIIEPWQPGVLGTIKTNPSRVLINRCKDMKENPPGNEWDGVYIMTSK